MYFIMYGGVRRYGGARRNRLNSIVNIYDLLGLMELFGWKYR